MSTRLKDIQFGTLMMTEEDVNEAISQAISSVDEKISALKNEVAGKQNALTPGENITIVNGVISSANLDDSIEEKINAKQDKLTPGAGLSIAPDGTISSSPFIGISCKDGYFNQSDGKFYSDMEYRQVITPTAGELFSDLSTGKVMVYRSSTIGYEETPFVTMAYIDGQIGTFRNAITSLSNLAASLLS